MKTIYLYIIAGALFFSFSLSAGSSNVNADVRPEVEVVFCLDTTGSMGGLIEGAKQKIWSIANQIIQGEPSPLLKIGLVGFRDNGDDYVTRVFPLDDDLDAVFENLMSFQAGGGGDTPEHVNRALHDSVREIDWSSERSTLKLIFLVGDSPPHIDYSDGYDYKETCTEAVLKDIIINTVQCGNSPETMKYWCRIAKLSEGSYTAIVQTGGMQIIETPMDAELSRLNLMLEETVVAYGSEETMSKSSARKKKVAGMSAPAAAERAAYKSADDEISSFDLIDSLKHGKIKLKNIKDKELPEEMRGLTLDEKREYLAQKEKDREELKGWIMDLSKERSAYISKKLSEIPREDSFDEVVLEFIKEQASEKGITY